MNPAPLADPAPKPAADTRVLVTGATGFLGRHVVQALLTAGWPVRVLARRDNHPALAQWAANPLVQVAVGDLNDHPTLAEALTGASYVVHAAAHVSFLRRDRERMRQVNALGTAHLVDYALAAGVRKLVYVSSVAALGRPELPTDTYTEDLRWTKSRRNSYYGYTKYLGEREVARGVAEGLPATILNPTIILGAGDWSQGSMRFFRAVDRGLRWYPTGTNGFVGAPDVAAACLRCLAPGSPAEGERFILCSENLPYRTLLADIAAALGRRPPHRPIPHGPSLAAAWLYERLVNLLGRDAVFTVETMRTAAGVSRYDNRRAREVLDLQFTSVADVVRATAARYLAENRPTGPLP